MWVLIITLTMSSAPQAYTAYDVRVPMADEATCRARMSHQLDVAFATLQHNGSASAYCKYEADTASALPDVAPRTI